MSNIDGKSENFELFEVILQTNLKLHNQLIDNNNFNFFPPALMSRVSLKTIKDISSPIRENLEENISVFFRKYVKPQSMATAKHKFQKLVFSPSNQKLLDFREEHQNLAKNSFWIAAHAIKEKITYPELPFWSDTGTNR